MMKFIPLFFLLAILPAGFAFDCSVFEEPEDCEYLKDVNESLIGNLLITDTFNPSHSFVATYNNEISPVKPYDVSTQSNDVIKNAWVSILRVQPSVLDNGTLYGDEIFTVFSDYNYAVQVPSNQYFNKKRDGRDCKILYYLDKNQVSLTHSLNGLSITGKTASFSIDRPSTIYADLYLSVRIRQREYEWDYEGDGDWDCEYDRTRYTTYNMLLRDTIQVSPYKTDSAKFQLQYTYSNTLQGNLTPSKNNYVLTIGDAYYLKQAYQFGAILTKSPNNYLQLTVDKANTSKSRILSKNQNTIVAPYSDACQITESTYFETQSKTCVDTTSNLNLQPIEQKEFSSSWRMLFILLILALVIYVSYRLLKVTWGRIIPILLLPLTIPFAYADSCGLTNLGACLPQSIYDFFMDLINAPIQPLISAIRYLMEQAIIIDPFFSIWQIVLYVMGFFYLLMFLFAGFSFLVSGHDVIKREMAKEWLKNTFLVMIFTSASFYLYQLVLEVSAVLTSAFLSTVPPEFFLLTIDTISNVALQSLASMSYLVVLGITVLILGVRYIIVAIGVIFVPIGLMCYFIPPLKSYGHFILQLLGIGIFLPVVNALIIIACSKLLEVGAFAHFKIFVMINCFVIVDIVMAMAIWHIVTKSGLANAGRKIVSAGKYIAALL